MLEKIVADKADVNSPDLQNRGSFLVVVVGPKTATARILLSSETERRSVSTSRNRQNLDAERCAR